MRLLLEREPALRSVSQIPAAGQAEAVSPLSRVCTEAPLPGSPRPTGAAGAQGCLSPLRVGLPHVFWAARLRAAQSPSGGPAAEGHVSPWLSCAGRCQPRPPSPRAFPHPGRQGRPARSFPKPRAPSAPTFPADPLQHSEGSPALGLHAQTQVPLHDPFLCLQEG